MPGPTIELPIWLVDEREQARWFSSLDHAGLYIEWMNHGEALFPEAWGDAVLLDNLGRRLHLVVKKGKVEEARLLVTEPCGEDVRLLNSLRPAGKGW
jgi:hypothetical protein